MAKALNLADAANDEVDGAALAVVAVVVVAVVVVAVVVVVFMIRSPEYC
jgi:heme/copper-type cytochrome/quinol oxidase subunit 2